MVDWSWQTAMSTTDVIDYGRLARTCKGGERYLMTLYACTSVGTLQVYLHIIQLSIPDPQKCD